MWQKFFEYHQINCKWKYRVFEKSQRGVNLRNLIIWIRFKREKGTWWGYNIGWCIYFA